jgi:hypothetical protein
VTNHPPQRTSRAPLLAVAAITVFMAFIGLRVHHVWIDEVAYAEAAINYVKDGTYTSAAYYTSHSDETHVSPSPAHSFLLIAWLKLFGVSQTAVRTLPLFFAVLATIIFWRACLRANLFHSQTAGVILVSVTLLSYGFSFSYASGRPESVSVLALSCMFYLATLPPSRLTTSAFFLLAVLAPFMQWALVIYTFIVGAVLLLFARDRALHPVLLAGGGMVLGLVLQVAIYKMAGLWEAWISLLSSERSVNLAQYLIERFSLRALLNHSNTLPKEFSAFVLIAGIAALGLAGWRLRIDRRQILARAAVVLFLLVLLGMYVLGKFPSYYGWMLTFPLAAILAAMFDRLPSDRRVLRSGALIIAFLSCVVGFPVQAAVALNDWPYRTPDRINEWLQTQIRPDDIVYCDYPFYYLAKERARKVFVGFHSRVMRPEEVDSVSLVLLSKTFCDWSHPEVLQARTTSRADWDPPRAGLLGNDWRYGILSAPNYSCVAFRLAPPARTPAFQ